MIDVTGMVMRSDLPLDLPARWTAQATLWIQRLTSLHNEHMHLSLEIPSDIDPEGRAYLEAVLTNMGNARMRAEKQWINLWSTDDMEVQTGDGSVLPNPLPDVPVPAKLPASLVDF